MNYRLFYEGPTQQRDFSDKQDDVLFNDIEQAEFSKVVNDSTAKSDKLNTPTI